MIKIGLTGSYFCGIDKVSELFENLGVPVFDADLLLKYLINYSEPHRENIMYEFGGDIYSSIGLKSYKFERKRDVNDLINLIEYEIHHSYKRFNELNKDKLYTIFKYSYLFERGLQEGFDYTSCVYRPKYMRRQDMISKTFISVDKIDKILESEMDEISKKTKSDFVLENYNSSADLAMRVKNLDLKIMKKNPDYKPDFTF